jgi:hypothetical protein
MPYDQDEVPEATVKAFQDALDDLQSHQLSDDEAVALFDMFPAGEYSGLFELEWSLLHAIESAPYGPDFLADLDDRSWWALSYGSCYEGQGGVAGSGGERNPIVPLKVGGRVPSVTPIAVVLGGRSIVGWLSGPSGCCSVSGSPSGSSC